jgi:hypothetical protein
VSAARCGRVTRTMRPDLDEALALAYAELRDLRAVHDALAA